MHVRFKKLQMRLHEKIPNKTINECDDSAVKYNDLQHTVNIELYKVTPYLSFSLLKKDKRHDIVPQAI